MDLTAPPSFICLISVLCNVYRYLVAITTICATVNVDRVSKKFIGRVAIGLKIWHQPSETVKSANGTEGTRSASFLV